VGSQELRQYLGEARPRYHFCGHFHENGQALSAPEGTRSFQLNAVNFLKAHQLNPGCIGVLTWAGPEEHRFELLDAPWLVEYTRYSFRAL
jgi:hypothetical protein